VRERLRQRAAGHCYLEGVMAVEAGCLAADDVGSEGGGKRIDRGECEEVWLSCHLDEQPSADQRVVGEECGWCGGAVVGSVPLSIAAGCFFVNVHLTSRE
jgi:hypothetical protein